MKNVTLFVLMTILLAGIIGIGACNNGDGAAGGLPDLIVTVEGQGISPWPPLTAQTAVTEAVLENIGNEPVDESFDIELYIDGNLVRDWRFSPVSEEEDPEHAHNPLVPGGTRIYGYDDVFSEGQHVVRWVVDGQDEIMEGDEGNNELEFTAVWQHPPDLIVEDIWPVGAAAGGQQSTWMIRVTNIGQGAATIPFQTTLWPEGIAGGAQENFWTQSLDAGDSATFETAQAFRSSGGLQLTVTVDPNNSVPEALPDGEKNNVLIKQFELEPVDLQVENVVVTPQNPRSCDLVTFSFRVRNVGGGIASQPFKVKVFPGVVNEELIQPILLTVNALDPGQGIDLEHMLRLPEGDHQVQIEADFPDPNIVYFELDRNNNVKVSQLHVREPFDGLSICFGESIYINPTDPAASIRDRDGDKLKDDLENQLANGFRPYFKFDDAETARRPFEPITLFQVRPMGCTGSGCSGKTEVWIRWAFMFQWDGGYGPDSYCYDDHMGDNDKATYIFTSSEGGYSWELTEISVGGGGETSLRWPQGYQKPAYMGPRVVPALIQVNLEIFDAHHPVIYMSAHKHHMYFDTSYDHKDSYYSSVPINPCNDDVNGKGAAFLSDLHSVFGDHRYNNVGEPGKHQSEHFVNCMTQFPATVIGRVVDVGDKECNYDYYSAWGASNFYEVEPNAEIWLQP
jgi:hypothetical protein